MFSSLRSLCVTPKEKNTRIRFRFLIKSRDNYQIECFNFPIISHRLLLILLLIAFHEAKDLSSTGEAIWQKTSQTYHKKFN